MFLRTVSRAAIRFNVRWLYSSFTCGWFWRDLGKSVRNVLRSTISGNVARERRKEVRIWVSVSGIERDIIGSAGRNEAEAVWPVALVMFPMFHAKRMMITRRQIHA